MTAFGPYKGTEIVDFRDLRDNRLFVISGATGSGKTTIFDGICFALYGQASGEDRTDIRAMRSDFAHHDTQTEVELLFEIHGRIYRIMRQIPYTKKGNKTETLASCEFYEQTEDGEVPIVDRQIVSEINKKAEQLIGFSQAQFSQIVMLPQGEFRKFLTSDTENKETIMRKIFKTEPYREIVDRLKVKLATSKDQLQIAEQKNKSYIEQISSLIPQRESLIFELLNSAFYNSNQIIDGLEEELIYYKEKIIQDKEVQQTANENHTKMLEYYHRAKNINERFVELDDRNERYTYLTEQIPIMEQKSKAVEQAQRAMSIEQLELNYAELEKEVKSKNEHVAKVTQDVKIIAEQLVQIEALYVFEESKKIEREEITEQLIRLNDALPKVVELAATKDQLLKNKNEHNRLKADLVEISDKAEQETIKTKSLADNKEELEKKIVPLDEKTDLLGHISEQHRIVQEFITMKEKANTLAQAQKSLETIYLTHKEKYDEMAQKWLNNEAATLAEKLHDGESCPVCGSSEHPQKAHREGISISKDELELANQELERVESDYRIAKANYESVGHQLNNKKEELTKFDLKIEEIERTNLKLQQEKTNLEQEVVDLRESRSQLGTIKEMLNKQSKVTEDLIMAKNECEKALMESSASLETKQAIFNHTIQTIPEEVRELNVLEKKIEDLQVKKKGMEKRWNEIQKKREEARDRLASIKSAEVHAITSLSEAEDKRVKSKERFTNALEKFSFSSEEAYQKARLDENALNKLKKEIEEFKQQYYSVREAIKELNGLLKDKERVDLKAIEQKLTELKQVYERAFEAYNKSVESEKAIVKLKQNLKDSSDEIAKLEKTYGKIASLYDVVRGHNGMKLSFERYIQIEYLEQIIHAANERLRDMSNGQFALIRSDRQEVRGRQSGLGLDVYDAYTGQTRDVKTLSGGEKFNASLCLALGMADVIQSFQGAVSIDTMFIDEGFGSLDEESLNNAIDTLIDLQKSGRIIGVISHVEELKAAFPAILEVRKSREGHSNTKFLIK